MIATLGKVMIALTFVGWHNYFQDLRSYTVRH